MADNNDLELFILQRLRSLNMNKSELMRKTGLSRTTYYNLVAGKSEHARLGTVIKLASTLKVHPMVILRRLMSNLEPLSHTEMTTLYANDVTGFVQDVTIPDNTLVTVGQRFEKKWEIQNLGKVPWLGRRLVCVSMMWSLIRHR